MQRFCALCAVALALAACQTTAQTACAHLTEAEIASVMIGHAELIPLERGACALVRRRVP